MVWILLVGAAIASAVWAWSIADVRTNNRIAIIATLAGIATAFNLIIPISNVEATTLVVVCSSVVLGWRSATVVGIVCCVASGAVAGIGPWTAWQAASFALIAAGVALWRTLARRAGGVPSAVEMVVMTVLVTIVYDVVLTATTISAVGVPAATTPAHAVVAALLLGIPFTIMHVVGNVALAMLFGNALIAALQRAAVRLTADREPLPVHVQHARVGVGERPATPAR